MIKAIKEHYNLNDTLLAINLNVSNQTVKAWKEGKKPRKDSYLALTELYKGINSEEQTSEEQTEEVTEEVTEVTEKKPYEISYPNNGEQIYYISYHSGQVKEWDFNISYEADKYLYDIGLYFDTEEEAEQFKREQTLIKKIKCWAKEQQGDWKLDWSNESQYKFTVDYSGLFEELCVRDSTVAIRFNSLPYFKSEKIAQACIDEFGDEILEVFC